MDVINQLFLNNSIESVILLIIIILVAGKFVWEILSFFYEKTKNYFNFKSKEDIKQDKLYEKIDGIKDDVNKVQDSVDQLGLRVMALEEDSKLNRERFLQEARATIIERHHHFCYQVKAIDDISMQYLEGLLLDYEKEGGDGYIHNLMEDLRRLPSIEAQSLAENFGKDRKE